MSGVIENVRYLKQNPTWTRVYLAPAALLYIAPLYARLFSTILFLDFVLTVFAIALHLLSFLATIWSMDMKARFEYRSSDNKTATHVLVNPKPHCGRAEICVVNRLKADELVGPETANVLLWFDFQRSKFELTGGYENELSKVEFKVTEAVEYYVNDWRGHSLASLAKAVSRWGTNHIDIPMPELKELMIEQATAPFFVFQTFSISLWCLDEYWYFSIFTLVMLVVFEFMVAKQRMSSIEMLRRAGRESYKVSVFRDSKWMSGVDTEDLVHGDIISLRAAASDGSKYLRDLPASASTAIRLVPCDLALLQGTAVVNEAMLTGESVPQLKEGLAEALDIDSKNVALSIFPSELNKEMPIHTGSLISGGTEIVQVSRPSTGNPRCSVPLPADGGVPAFVLRTGWQTSHGNLLRTMLYAQERVTANNAEAFLFIGFLLIYAIVAAAYVLDQGLKDPSRDRWKLILHCIMILTSVVPPELPMELSLAVNTSLANLNRAGIFCTEPFRIPFGGKVDVCCFDKTGTLTSDTFIVKGVATSTSQLLVEPSAGNPAMTIQSQTVLACCHSLSRIRGKTLGDPLEVTAFQASGWSFADSDVMKSSSLTGAQLQYQVVRRYAFSSALRRMSCLIRSTAASSGSMLSQPLKLVSKGAPETIAPLLQTLPAEYHATYKYFATRGYRVLALALRDFPLTTPLAAIQLMPREEVERDLVFAGFLVLDCPLKRDSKKVIRNLMESSHRVIMITGDAPLTAAAVAKDLKMTTFSVDNTYILSDGDQWLNLTETKAISYEAGLLAAKASAAALVVSGAGIDYVMTNKLSLSELTKVASVFCRVSPSQKAQVIAALKDAGSVTLMCGDGSNDVGALKTADVGVSIINSPELEDIQDTAAELSKKGRAVTAAEIQDLQLRQSGTIVKFGDASIASPFTCRSPSIKLVSNILRHGRCTLVTTIQMCKILGVNSLFNAYQLSVLYLHGVKMGDTQASMVGVMLAAFFFFLSISKPLKELSSLRPTAKLFSGYVLTSVIGQFLIHLVTMMVVVQNCNPYVIREGEAGEAMKPDGKFAPNIINTVVYLLTLVMQTNAFGVNYRGHPFMSSLTENKLLFRGVLVSYAVAAACVFEVFPPLNDLLQLVSVPEELQVKVVSSMVVDTVAAFAIEHFARWFFETRHAPKQDDKAKRKGKAIKAKSG